MSAPQADQTGSPGGGMAPWQKGLLLVLLLPFSALLLPSLAVLTLGMLPTLAAYVADRGRDKQLALTVGLMNFCGCVPVVVDLWWHGHDFQAVGAVIGNVFDWLIAYGAAGCGWSIYLVMPPLAATYYVVNSQARVRMLKQHQRRLVELWGEEVAEGFDPPSAPPHDR